MKPARLAFLPTSAQEQWLKAESARTGNSMAAIVRDLLQVKIDELPQKSGQG